MHVEEHTSVSGQRGLLESVVGWIMAAQIYQVLMPGIYKCYLFGERFFADEI